MIQDHFEKNYLPNRVDWNFNVVFHAQPQVAQLAATYRDHLDSQNLYSPIPGKWIHSTILRMGLISDFTEVEMLAVAEVLRPKLAILQLPIFCFNPWNLSGSDVVLEIYPRDDYRQIYECVAEAFVEVIGSDRVSVNSVQQYRPHITLAYTKSHNNVLDIAQKLFYSEPAYCEFAVKSVSLIKQWPTDGHYEWEVVRELPVGIEHSGNI